MKKNYEAPAFEIITYSLQEAIAASCTISKWNNAGHEDACLDPLLGRYQFGTTEADCASGPAIDGYCYFTSTEGNIVSTS